MKHLLLWLAALIPALPAACQDSSAVRGSKIAALPVVYLLPSGTVHWISPEPIQYADISSENLRADLPLKNLLRIRLADSSIAADAVVTIVGESFLAQYHVMTAAGRTLTKAVTAVEIRPCDVRPLEVEGIGMSGPQLKRLAMDVFTQSPGHPLEKAAAFGIRAALFHVYSAGDYLFIDLGFNNDSNLPYDIDELRFTIDDQKITKETNVQSVQLQPVFTLFSDSSFRRHWRNIFVFRKMTFPGDKELRIRLSEKQLSGRVVTLFVPYRRILTADLAPL